MIQIHTSPLGQSVKMTELYDFLELEKSQYSRFVKSNLVENPFFDVGKDYLTFVSSNNLGKKGQFRQEYHVHIDSAKKLCMVSKSKKGNEIRDYLLRLTKQVENKDLLSHKEVIDLIKLVQVFSVYEFRQKAKERNQSNYIERLTAPKIVLNQKYAMFHKWRNEILGTGKEVLALRVREFCLLNQKKMPNNLIQDNVLGLFGEYEHIKNAVWDLLSSKNKSNEFAEKIAKFSQEIAVAIKPFSQRLNESDLFFEQIDKAVIDQVFLS